MGRDKSEPVRRRNGESLVLEEGMETEEMTPSDVQPFHVDEPGPSKPESPRVLVEGNLTLQESTTWVFSTHCTGSMQVASGSRIKGDLLADGLTTIGSETFVEGSVRARGRLEWGAGSTATDVVEGAPFVTTDGEVAKKLVARAGVGVVTDEKNLFAGGS